MNASLKIDKSGSDPEHNVHTAAKFLGMTTSKLQGIIKNRKKQSAPAFYRPSPKSTVFLESDLIAWKATWHRPATAYRTVVT